MINDLYINGTTAFVRYKDQLLYIDKTAGKVIDLTSEMTGQQLEAFDAIAGEYKSMHNFPFKLSQDQLSSIDKLIPHSHKKLPLEPTYRKGFNDMLPPSAVCLTQLFDVAPLFPISDHSKKSWIYIVYVENAYLTYKTQIKNNNPLQFAKEVAIRDIPPGHILGAIECERFFNFDENPSQARVSHYTLTGNVIWNPKNQNEIMRKSKQPMRNEINELIANRSGKFIICPTKETPQSGFIDAKEHENRVSLVSFATAMSKEPNNVTAIAQTLEHCNNINAFILGTDLTPLIFACKQHNYYMIAYLLDHGADKAVKNQMGKTAFDFCDKQAQLLLYEKNLIDKIDEKINEKSYNPFLFDLEIKNNAWTGLKKEILSNKSEHVADIIDRWYKKNQDIISEPRNKLRFLFNMAPDEINTTQIFIAELQKSYTKEGVRYQVAQQLAAIDSAIPKKK